MIFFMKKLKRFLLSRGNLFLTGIIYFISSIIFGLYMINVEGLSAIDSIYYLVTTSTTVGYGDISPTKDLGKILGLTYMIISITSLGVLIGVVGDRLLTFGEKIRKGLIMIKKDVDLLIVGYPSEEKIRNLIEQLNKDEDFKEKHIVLISHSLTEKPLWFSDFDMDFINGLGSDEQVLLRANIKSVKKALILAEDSEDIRSDDFSSSTVSVIESLNSDVHTIVEKVRKSSALFIAANADIITNVSSANLLAQEILNEGAIEFEKAIFDNEIEGTQYNEKYNSESKPWKEVAYEYILKGKVPEGFKNKGEEFNFLPLPENIVEKGAVIKYRGK